MYCICSSVTEFLFRKSTTKHTMMTVVVTEVSREITAITMDAVATSSESLLDACSVSAYTRDKK